MNAAIVGTGGYAYEILKRIWLLPQHYQVVGAVCLPGIKNLGAEECRHKGIPVYESVDELLYNSQSQIDIVFAPTSIHSHFEIAAKCLEYGCNVFIEKPPVATIQDYDELLRLSKKKREKSSDRLPISLQ